MKTGPIPWLVGLTLIPALGARNAHAQDAPAEAQEPADETTDSKMNLSVAAPSEPVQRKDYVHEGFYFRFGVGPGFQYTSIDATNDALDGDGGAFALGGDLLLGGSPSPGIALGAGVMTNLAFGALPDNTGGDGTVVHFLAGPFFDAFPNDKKGWHLGALVGLAGLGGSLPNDAGTLLGGGAAAFGGYDMWVAPDWSVGFNLRLEGGYMVGDDLQGSAVSTMFMVTILNH